MDTDQEAAPPQTGKHWINGEWVHSATVAKAVNPSTGEVLGQYSAGGRIEAAVAISAARRALAPALGLMTLNSDRGRFSNSLTDLMSERKRLR
jgi:acyl-CoA reductase-like NAD-dependent aldehyde dehydrogenase